ncbi:MAG TPA: carbon-nitrogen family hydrolase [Tepidisphaeraceae bacterium]|jgi:predicted amidohydrolase
MSAAKLIGVQPDIAWEDKAATFERVRRLLAGSPPEPGSLVVLPEMFSTGFSMNVAGIHEGAERPAERFLQALAREYRAVVLGGAVNIGPDGRGRNQAVAFSPDGAEVVRYDKMYPFSLGKETDHYTAGTGVKLFEWQGFKVAPFVCYDLRFPEIFRHATAAGAELMIVIASWPFPRVQHWVTLLQARAIENQAYVIGVNRCGADPQHTYPGRSSMYGPRGEILIDAGDAPGVIRSDVSLEIIRGWRRDFPVLRDARLC